MQPSSSSRTSAPAGWAACAWSYRHRQSEATPRYERRGLARAVRRRASAHVLPRSRVSLYGGTRRWSHVHGSRCHPRDRASGLSCASRVGLWGGLWAVGAFAGVPSFFCAQSRESTVLYFFISSMYLYRYTVYALRLQSYKRRPRASCRECRASVRAAVCVRPAPQSLLRGTIRDSVVARARIPYSFHVKRIRDPRTAARGTRPAPRAPEAASGAGQRLV